MTQVTRQLLTTSDRDSCTRQLMRALIDGLAEPDRDTTSTPIAERPWNKSAALTRRAFVRNCQRVTSFN
jgi:hypothetical protein